jgi:hypothetical protein
MKSIYVLFAVQGKTLTQNKHEDSHAKDFPWFSAGCAKDIPFVRAYSGF